MGVYGHQVQLIEQLVKYIYIFFYLFSPKQESFRNFPVLPSMPLFLRR